jgi:hypothetical protein
MPTPIGHLLFQLERLAGQNQDPQQQQQPTEQGPRTRLRREIGVSQRTRPDHARGVTVSYLYMTDSVPTAAR